MPQDPNLPPKTLSRGLIGDAGKLALWATAAEQTGISFRVFDLESPAERSAAAGSFDVNPHLQSLKGDDVVALAEQVPGNKVAEIKGTYPQMQEFWAAVDAAKADQAAQAEQPKE